MLAWYLDYWDRLNRRRLIRCSNLGTRLFKCQLLLRSNTGIAAADTASLMGIVHATHFVVPLCQDTTIPVPMGLHWSTHFKEGRPRLLWLLRRQILSSYLLVLIITLSLLLLRLILVGLIWSDGHFIWSMSDRRAFLANKTFRNINIQFHHGL